MKVSKDEWLFAQKGEHEYWGDQDLNGEKMQAELRQQLVYAEWMGLVPNADGEFELGSRRIVDIGGGPVSMLLKRKKETDSISLVIDPLQLQQERAKDYYSRNINYIQRPAEEFLDVIMDKKYDEVWMYNVLQHVMDPELILTEAIRIGKCIRIFEVLNIAPDYMHPWMFDREFFDSILGEGGKTVVLDGAVKGEAYYGVFKF